ncbi:MAG: glycosyltransferase [Hamadaea sp.]|uniref:glycosyltransferase n=1 Tax=Hamadaea sp. TaxID=2024425 RepID=UPI001808E099|nr:glycosyltransferase [Hamadaea sp.]NUT22828.1 glycosyltransferase [Hamadaea sp.]
MRTLLLSPFAPHLHHDHAASDTIVQLVPRLAKHVELFVYSPQTGSAIDAPNDLDYTLLPAGPQGAAGVAARLGPKPAWLRQAWPKQATREVHDLINRLRPDVVHAEYLQCAEAIAGVPRSVLGIHDVTENVMRQSLLASSLPKKPYRLAELWRTAAFEREAIRNAAAVLTLSEADHSVASRYNRSVFLARPGIELGELEWRPAAVGPSPVLVFAGAMWRRANALIAHFLVHEVMPEVWRRHPQTQLRIVGARPPHDVIELAADPRVVVTGEVPDIRTEMLSSTAVLAPSIVGGGVLMKVVHAMALGCPVVTSSGPAASVQGDASVLFIADEAADLAAAVCQVLSDPVAAAAVGRAGRRHVGDLFRWDDTVRAYLDAYEIASRQ